MQPDAVSTLFDAWAASLARGEQPDPQAYLEQAGAGAAELERLMDAFLLTAPRREPDEETVALVRAWSAGESPLVALRVRRGLRRDDVVDAVMTEFALAAEKRAGVKGYLHRLEAGLLDPRRLSSRLLDALAHVLGAPVQTILAARVRPMAASTAYRLTHHAVPPPAAAMPEVPAAAKAEEPDDPELAALFLSGR